MCLSKHPGQGDQYFQWVAVCLQGDWRRFLQTFPYETTDQVLIWYESPVSNYCYASTIPQTQPPTNQETETIYNLCSQDQNMQTKLQIQHPIWNLPYTSQQFCRKKEVLDILRCSQRSPGYPYYRYLWLISKVYPHNFLTKRQFPSYCLKHARMLPAKSSDTITIPEEYQEIALVFLINS